MPREIPFPNWLFPKRLGSIMLMIVVIAIGVRMVRLATEPDSFGGSPKIARSFLIKNRLPQPTVPSTTRPPILERPYFLVDSAIDPKFLRQAPSGIDEACVREPRSLRQP